jgi:hypothetical protein
MHCLLLAAIAFIQCRYDNNQVMGRFVVRNAIVSTR